MVRGRMSPANPRSATRAPISSSEVKIHTGAASERRSGFTQATTAQSIRPTPPQPIHFEGARSVKNQRIVA